MRSCRVLLAVLLLWIGLWSAVPAPPATADPQAAKHEAVQIHNEQVPYALRATMLLKLLANMEESDVKDGTDSSSRLLARLGLDADDPGSDGLVEAALAVKAATPPVPLGYLKLDEAESIAAQRARRLEIHRLAGEAFGAWLRSLEIDAPEINSLLSTLLDSPYVDMTIGTTDPELDLAFLAARARAFEQSLEAALGYVPALMQHPGREDEQ